MNVRLHLLLSRDYDGQPQVFDATICDDSEADEWENVTRRDNHWQTEPLTRVDVTLVLPDGLLGPPPPYDAGEVTP